MKAHQEMLIQLLLILAAKMLLVSCEVEQVEYLQGSLQAPADNQTFDSQSKTQKCVPMLNLASILGNSNSNSNSNQTIVSEKQTYNSRFISFPINDIDLPITPTEGSFKAAMSFISSLQSQFDDPIEGGGNENLVRFRENRLNIQGLNLTMLNIHLYTENDPKFSVGVTIKNTTLTGSFAYNGPMALTESKLAGYYRMSIDNVYLIMSSNLTKSAKDNPDNVFKTRDFNLNITNLGYISIDILDSRDSFETSSNYLLRILQRFLQRTVKRTYYTFENYIKETLEIESKRWLDCELTRFKSLNFANETSSDGKSKNIAYLASILNSEIVRSQFDTVSLPDFEHQQSVLGSLATIQLNNGSLTGLNNIKLNAETRIKLQDEHLFVNTSIGWSNLKPYYNWTLLIGSSKALVSKGFVSFIIKDVDFDATITKGLTPHTRITVDQLLIKQLDGPKMDINGLPGMNRITRGMVNFFMGRLKQRLVSSIQPVLRQQLERSLNRMSPFADKTNQTDGDKGLI